LPMAMAISYNTFILTSDCVMLPRNSLNRGRIVKLDEFVSDAGGAASWDLQGTGHGDASPAAQGGQSQ
jgi:hypothetical protein